MRRRAPGFIQLWRLYFSCDLRYQLQCLHHKICRQLNKDFRVGTMLISINMHVLFWICRAYQLSNPLPLSPYRSDTMEPTTTRQIQRPPQKRPRTVNKRNDRSVPFEEMRRLMQIYGSIKCLRKRQTAGGDDNTKVDSVKRKFYRWFPDLEERFFKDTDGYFRPRFGHEFELGYRREMRAKDGELLSKKRARCRSNTKIDIDGGHVKKAKKPRTSPAPEPLPMKVSSFKAKAACPPPPNTAISTGGISTSSKGTSTCVRTVGYGSVQATSQILGEGDKVITVSRYQFPTSIQEDYFARIVSPVTPDMAPSSSFSAVYGITGDEIPMPVDLDHDHNIASCAGVQADTEALDGSFIAEKGIFDDVEESFYGSAVVSDCASAEWSSSSSSSASPDIEDAFGQSIDDCCDEVLGSNSDNDSILFDMISN